MAIFAMEEYTAFKRYSTYPSKNVMCKVCSTTCNSEIQLKDHKRARKHKDHVKKEVVPFSYPASYGKLNKSISKKYNNENHKDARITEVIQHHTSIA